MSHAAISPIKVKITRAWTDLAPKLLAFLTGGTAASAIVAALDRYAGVHLEPGLAALLVTLAATLLGYFVKDKAIIDAGTVAPGEVAVITAMRAPDPKQLDQ
jgi:energy-converting hydrogenase Eha subunit B